MSAHRRSWPVERFIDEIKREPEAFKRLMLRVALLQRDAYRRTWSQPDLKPTKRQACQTIVALLEMAARDGVEGALAYRLEMLLLIGELPDVMRLRQECSQH